MTDEYEAREQVYYSSNTVFELSELNSFLKDDKIEDMLDRTLKVIAKPTIPKEKAAALVAQFQAMSLYCKSKSLSYGYVLGANAGSENSKKKAVYNTLAKEFHEMAQSTKYLVNL